MKYTEAIAALRPLQSEHPTIHGEREGFYMSDAVDVLGGYTQASNLLMVMQAEGMLECEFVVEAAGDEAKTLYRLLDAVPPSLH